MCRRTSRRLVGLGGVLLATFWAATANAAIHQTNASEVSWVETYTQHGNGDVIVNLAANSLNTSCPGGFWIRGGDAGAKGTHAQILAAKASGAAVRIWADTSIIWTGSSSATCLVWAVRTD
jgi:hypothetical protein